MVVWVIAILAAVAIPVFGTAQDTSRARLGAGAVAQEIRKTGQTAFAERRAYTLDAGTQSDALLLKPQGRASRVVLQLDSNNFRAVLVPSTLDLFTSTLSVDSGGDATSSISWAVVSGKTSVTVTQSAGTINPVISPATRASTTAIDKYKAQILQGPG